MPRSDRPGDGSDPSERPGPGEPTIPSGLGPDRAVPPELLESWDPVDDETGTEERRQVPWSWHGQASWGRRLVAAFPAAALVAALAVFVVTTLGADATVSVVPEVVGTGGATLSVETPAPAISGTSAITGRPLTYQGVTFGRPSQASRPIQGSSSLALPPYDGWEANGSAGPDNGLARAAGGLLHVAVRHATPGYAGWFLTASSPTPETCAFQFAAASPPPVSGTAPGTVGELVMAVQTSDTTATGDINYVVVAELVHADGSRQLEAGYSLGHLSHATEHFLKIAPWSSGPLQVAIETNGDNRLEVWVNGSIFLDATDLSMGIVPPFEPYLEVQARHTAYTVAFRSYSSVCGDDVVVSHLPDGAVATLAGRSVTARDGRAVFVADRSSSPVTGVLTLSGAGMAGPVSFPSRTYWPGDRLAYRAGSA